MSSATSTGGSDDALAGDAAGIRPPVVAPFVRLGSWIGGDRDGNPNVTAAITREAMQIQADHVLRALEQATDAARSGAHPGRRDHTAVAHRSAASWRTPARSTRT